MAAGVLSFVLAAPCTCMIRLCKRRRASPWHWIKARTGDYVRCLLRSSLVDTDEMWQTRAANRILGLRAECAGSNTLIKYTRRRLPDSICHAWSCFWSFSFPRCFFLLKMSIWFSRNNFCPLILNHYHFLILIWFLDWKLSFSRPVFIFLKIDLEKLRT